MSGHDGDVIIPIGADIDDKKVKGAISKFARSLKQAFGAATSDVNSTSKAMDNMSLRIEKAAQKVEKLRKKQEELGKQKVATEDYKNLEKEIEKAQRKLDGLYERSIKFEEMGGKVGSKQWSSLAYDLEKAEDHMNNLLSKQAVMKTMGRAYIPGTETSAYADTTQQLQNARTELDALNRKQSETRSETNKTASNIGAKFRNAFSGLGKMASNAFGKIKNFFSKMKGHAKDSFNGVDKSLHRSLKNILKYAFGIRSLFILFRRLKSAVKDGLGTMAKAFPSMNAQLSNLKNTFNQFKNSLATAFQPLVSAVIPVLVTIINYATQAANAVASFFATLTGQKYILKATKGTESFAAAEDKSTDSTKKNTKAVEDNQKQLGHYDKLNVIDQDKDKDKDASPSSGAGSGAGGLAGSYEKGEIEEAASKFAQMVKKAWKKADFTEVGKYIGQKLKNALDSIPWNGIQEKAKKVGKSLGTLIAGFISVKGLAKSIGQTIGQALNTLMNGLQTFVKNVPWAKFGKFLADGLSSALLAKDKNGRTVIVNIGKTIKDITNAAIDTLSGFAKNVKWKKIGTEISNTLKDTIKGLKAKEFGESVSSLVNGIVTLIYEVVSNKKTWKHLGAKIADGINGFFTKTKWHKLGQAISDTITGLEDAIETALDNIEWEEVGNAIGEFLGNINWWKIFKNALVIVGKAFWGILKALFTPSGDTKTDITKAIIAGLGTIFVLKKFSSLFSTVKALFSGLLEKGAIGAGTSSVVSKLSTSLSGVLGKVGLVAGVAVAGLALGKAIGELIMTGVKEEMEARELANKVAHQIGKNEVASITKRLQELNKQIDKSIKVTKSFRSAIDKINNKKSLKTLVNDVMKLQKKSKLTGVEQEALRKKIKKLTKAYPELSKYVNKNTGKLEISRKKLLEVINAHKKQTKAVEAQKKAEELYNQQAPLAEAVKKTKDEMDKAQAIFDKHNKELEKIGKQQGKTSDAYRKQLTVTGDVANALINARSCYNKATEAQKDNNDAIGEANNLMTWARVKTEKYTKATYNLKTTMNKLNIDGKEQKIILENLKDALDNGKISWGQYKKLTNGAYKSTNKFKQALDKVAGKDGKKLYSPTLDVKTKGKKDIDNTKKVLDDVSGKNGKKKYSTTVNIKTTGGKELSNTVKNYVKLKDKTVKIKMKTLFKTPTTWDKTQQELWKKAFPDLFKATGGIFTKSGWHNVQQYAGGGSPRSGQFFMARENGIPELVGTIKNHTAVMNNNQIVASVANGVYRAVAGVANQVLPYVRSQTNAMSYLAQNGLQVSAIANGNIIPANKEFLSALSTQNKTNIEEIFERVEASNISQAPVQLILNSKVLAEVVWDEQEKKYKQTRSSTLAPKLA